MIPDDIMCRTDLTHLAKCLYGYMCRKAQAGRWSGGTRLLARLCGTGHQQVARSIKELEQHHLLQVLRGRSGQRPSYLIEKASHIATLPQPKSVSHSDGASHIATEAAHIATRKRERPSESKKKPPKAPLGKGGLSSALSKTEGQEKKPASVAERELRQAVLERFYPDGVPTRQQRRVEGDIDDLVAFSATPEEFDRRCKRYFEVYFDSKAPCTLSRLVSRWNTVKPVPAFGEEELPHG